MTPIAPENRRMMAMLFGGDFSFANFLTDVLAVFLFVVWFWLLVVIYADLFRRHDISGWGKALWVIVLLLFSYIGIFAYLISQGRGMAERNSQQVQQARDELRRVVGFSAADEIGKLDQLKKSGSITGEEYARLRTKLVS
ncbi:MAG: PLD nuclease N-terminal domain-containing protein [Methyloceanibacter sp.]